MARGIAVKGRPNKVMRLLAEKYPTKEAVYEQLIYLQSRLSLPKGIEHFMSDLHGEYASFFHILNNCSGVIREKVDYVFGERPLHPEIKKTEKNMKIQQIRNATIKIDGLKTTGLWL